MPAPLDDEADTLPLIDPDRVYTATEAARIFGVNYSQPVRWAARGHFATVQQHPLLVKGSELVRYGHERRAAVKPGTGVLAVARSKNAKLGLAASTIVARQSCPDSCAFKEDGCYAEHDSTRTHWDRITAGAPAATPLDLARAEAAAIDGLPADRDLRLHVAGDSVTEEGTRLIADACGRYVDRGRVPLAVSKGPVASGAAVRAPAVWAYSHGWRLVPRDAWGRVSVLASCETPEDVRAAHTRGYAAALVVPEFEYESAYPLRPATWEGYKVLPCPQQTRDRVCTECRLCFADGRLRERKLVIGFALHGWGSNKARRALARVSLPVVSVPEAA